MEQNKKTITYLALTLFVSWAFIGTYYLLGGHWNNKSAMIIGVVYMYIPLLMALVSKKWIHKEPLKVSGLQFKANGWWLLAVLLMPMVALAALGLNLLLPDYTYCSDMSAFFAQMSDKMSADQIAQAKQQMEKIPFNMLSVSLANALIMGATVNALAAFGEEYGWRGYLFDLLKGKTFMKATVITGLVWGVWHAPLILMGHNYAEHNIIGVFFMIVFCLLLSPVFMYVRIKTKSVFAAAILHGTVNASAGIPLLYLSKTHDLVSGLTGVTGFIVLLLVNVGIYVYDIYVSKEKVFKRPI